MDLENAFGGVLRGVVGLAVRELGLDNGWCRHSCLCVLVQRKLCEQLVVTVFLLVLATQIVPDKIYTAIKWLCVCDSCVLTTVASSTADI